MCETNITWQFTSRLNAEDRDELRDFARKRVRKAVDQEARKFWEGVVVACQHPKTQVPVTGEGQLSFIPNGDPRQP